MLYLIEDRDYLKIGYTANVEDRKKAYQLHNCYARFIAVKEGSATDERKLHKQCKQWHYQGEWFYNTPEVKKIFDSFDGFKYADYIWLKELITKRYIQFLKTKQMDPVSYKISNKIRSIEKAVQNDNLQFNLKTWVRCYYQQEKIIDALNYIRGCDKYRIPNKNYEFEIFPNTVYNVLNDMYPYFVDLVAKEEEIKKLKIEIDHLKKYKYGSYEEENEYWCAYHRIKDYDEKFAQDRMEYFMNLHKQWRDKNGIKL